MKNNVAAIYVIAALVLAGLGALHFASSPAYSGTSVPITIGTSDSELNTLIYIAEDQGYFKSSGLNLTFKHYDSGSQAAIGMLSDAVNMAAATEFIIASHAIRNEPISDIACISKTQNEYLIVRTDHGIANISNLEGKKIGVPAGTATLFYLGRFLSLSGMSMQEVEIVNITAPGAADAISNGSVDAVMSWQPFVGQIQDRLGNRTSAWPAQSGQLSFWNIVAKEDWIALHPEEINRFLQALAQAEHYYMTHPGEARAIVQKRLNYTDEHMDAVWPEVQPTLSLDQSIVTAMEDEGRWMIKNNITTAREIPDFQKNIYTTGLEAVAPESVNVIG